MDELEIVDEDEVEADVALESNGLGPQLWYCEGGAIVDVDAAFGEEAVSVHYPALFGLAMETKTETG